MGARRKAREAAIQVLYQLDGSAEDADAVLALYWDNLDSGGHEDREFTDQLVRGVASAREQIDAKIRETSRHWRIERMARVDRNIIRLGTFELMMLPDVPARVTLNEAVELAKRFGNEDSPAFVNGVLDRVANDLHKP